MADTVQHLLEELIPELEEYERKGYFNKTELKAIILKRRDFEYHLKRRAALKIDFYRYIDYERKLEQLRLHRKKKLGIKGGKGIAENAITKRIHFIFERASRKFKSDLQLWVDWLAFCRQSRSTKMFSKVVTKALQRHATTPLLWIEAATWEFEQCGNPAAARSLMQQGLRMCKHEEVMWVEYLRMELMYVQRLRVRREVLGLDVPGEEPGGAAAAQQAGTEGGAVAQEAKPAGKSKRRRQAAQAEAAEGGQEQEAAAQPSGDAEAAEKAGPSKAGPEKQEEDAATAASRAVLTGAVPRVVLRAAVAALPRSLSLRRSLLAVLARFGFPGVRTLEAEAYDGVAADFPADEDAWELLARRPVDAAAASAQRGEERDGNEAEAAAALHAAVTDTYRRAVRAVPTAGMYERYAAYLESRLQGLLQQSEAARVGAGGEPSTSEPAGKALRKRGRAAAAAAAAAPPPTALLDGVVAAGAELLGVYAAAHAARCAAPGLYLRWASWAQRLGQTRMAAGAARHGCARHPACGELWAARLGLEAEAVSGKGRSGGEGAAAGEGERVLAALRQAVDAVPPAESASLWLAALEHTPPASASCAARLADMFVAVAMSAPVGPVTGGLGQAAATLLERLRATQGVEAARAFYRRLLTLPAPGGDFFRAAVAMELAEEQLHQQQGSSPLRGAGLRGSSKGSSKGSHVRQLFEAAVAVYGHNDVELWLRYAHYEAAAAAQGAGSVYWRATRELADPDAFCTRYHTECMSS